MTNLIPAVVIEKIFFEGGVGRPADQKTLRMRSFGVDESIRNH